MVIEEAPQARGFHLFQRVVGFRPLGEQKITRTYWKEFPSLSESSGFPTIATNVVGNSISAMVSISFRE